MKPSDAWTPRHQAGGVYCSPACGGKCKKSDHDLAVKNANDLVKQLGKGWHPVVWENLGWFYRAVHTCGKVKVYPIDSIAGYRAVYHGVIQRGAIGETPREAVQALSDELLLLTNRIENDRKAFI